MSETTNIAWADSTFNPWEGCSKISPGCDSCYAEARNQRYHGGVNWGPGAPRRRTSPAYWRQPLAWNKKAAESGKPWRVFCGSLCDVFDNEVPNEWRNDLWELVLHMPHLTWMLLTKRVGSARAMLPWGDAAECPVPPNVWIGATVVNQEEADRDIPKLLRVPAAVRFLSIEPMLGPIDLRLESRNDTARWDAVGRALPLRRIDLCIVGGESDQPGHRARPFNIEWARDIVRQCKAAGVAAFVKQLGSQPRGWCAWNAAEHIGAEESRALIAQGEAGECVNYEAGEQAQQCECYGRRCFMLQDRAGADPSEWPEDLRVREFPR